MVKLNRAIQKIISEKKAKEEIKAVENIKINSREFFRYANRHKDLRTGIGPM